MLRVCVCNFAVVVRHEKRLRRMYCHLWPVRLLQFFFATSPQKRRGFRKKNVEHRIRVLIFSAAFFSCKVPHSKKNSAKYYNKCAHVLMLSTRYSCQILIKVGFFYGFSKKKTRSIKCYENPSSGSPVVSCGQSDGCCGVIVALSRTRLKM